MDFHLIPVFRKWCWNWSHMTSVEFFTFMGRRVELVMKCQRWDQYVRSCRRYPTIFGWSSVRCRRYSRQVGPHICGSVVAATNQEPVHVTVSALYGLSKSYRETSVCVWVPAWSYVVCFRCRRFRNFTVCGGRCLDKFMRRMVKVITDFVQSIKIIDHVVVRFLFDQ
jgi:hypothetical protein